MHKILVRTIEQENAQDFFLLLRLHKNAQECTRMQEKARTKTMAKANAGKRFWTVRINFRWTDLSFQFTEAEEAAIFAQNALDNFAPHCSDYYTGEAPQLSARIEILSAEENAEKMEAFLNATQKKESAEE